MMKIIKKILYAIEEPYVKEHAYLLSISEAKFMMQRILISLFMGGGMAGLSYCIGVPMLYYCIPVTIIMIYFYPINMLKKYKLKRQDEINEAFPIWILQLESLVLSNNISNCVKKSIDVCPKILKEEIQILADKIEVEPINKEHYLSFLEEYKTSNITEVMLALYQFNFVKKEQLAYDFSLIHHRIDKLKMDAQEKKYRIQADIWGLILISLPLLSMVWSMYFCMILSEVIFSAI